MQQTDPVADPGEREVLKWLNKMPMRLTRLRINIGRVLMAAGDPPTAEALFNQLLKWDESISLGSVYRILKEWEDAGMVTRKREVSGPGNKAVYVINGRPRVSRAYVFRCTACGRQQRVADSTLGEQLAEAGYREGFRLSGDIVIAACCAACAEPHSHHAPAEAVDQTSLSQPDYPTKI